MIRTRLTWVVVGGVVALLVVAGVDALRSSESETAASATMASTTALENLDRLSPRCTRPQIVVSIEVRGGIATNVVREFGSDACHLRRVRLGLTIRDRAGKTVWEGAMPAFEGNYSPGFEQTVHFPYPNPVPHCDRRGPFLALVTVGPYSVRRNLSGDEIGCP